MKIDFYILEAASGQKSWHFACQLLEKIVAEQKRAYVHLDSRDGAERFDNLLWTYREDSFLPHHLYDPTDDNPPPIQLGHAKEAPRAECDSLLNLSTDIPPFYTQFAHLIEIVFSDPLVQQLARERFKRYRDQGHEMNTYKLKANEI